MVVSVRRGEVAQVLEDRERSEVAGSLGIVQLGDCELFARARGMGAQLGKAA